jgi:acyl-CoA thioester hydrolase
MPHTRDDFRFFETVSTRWADMDTYGHVNNARYFTYCESARMAYFTAVRMDEHAEAPSHGPALAAANLDFLRQVHHPATLEVGVTCPHLSRRSWTLDYTLFDTATGEPVADGSSVIAWVDYEAGKAIALPDGLRRAISRLEDRGSEGEDGS